MNTFEIADERSYLLSLKGRIGSLLKLKPRVPFGFLIKNRQRPKSRLETVTAYVLALDRPGSWNLPLEFWRPAVSKRLQVWETLMTFQEPRLGVYELWKLFSRIWGLL